MIGCVLLWLDTAWFYSYHLDFLLWQAKHVTAQCQGTDHELMSAVNLALAGFPLTNALSENMPSHY